MGGKASIIEGLVKALGVEAPAFQRWFGASKIVDEAGKPRILYHGTPKAGFSAFDPAMINQSSGTGAQGFNFTNHPLGAETYSGTKKNAVIHEGPEEFNPEYHGAPGNYPVFLKMENPLEVDFYDPDMDAPGSWTNAPEASGYGEMSINQIAKMAQRMGHDGLVAKNIMDEGRFGQGYAWGDQTHIVFDPKQIKSIHNRGTFDPKDPDILKSIAAAPVGAAALLEYLKSTDEPVKKADGGPVSALGQAAEPFGAETRRKMAEQQLLMDEQDALVQRQLAALGMAPRNPSGGMSYNPPLPPRDIFEGANSPFALDDVPPPEFGYDTRQRLKRGETALDDGFAAMEARLAALDSPPEARRPVGGMSYTPGLPAPQRPRQPLVAGDPRVDRPPGSMPAAPKPVIPIPRARPKPESYSIREGDNPTKIAAMFGMSLKELEQKNPGILKRAKRLKIGTEVVV